MSMNSAVGLIIGIIGISLLIYVDWKIAVGVFLVIWADNISREL